MEQIVVLGSGTKLLPGLGLFQRQKLAYVPAQYFALANNLAAPIFGL